MSVSSTLELPSDGWSFRATGGARALLQQGNAWALVELSDAGQLTLVALRSAGDDPGGNLLFEQP